MGDFLSMKMTMPYIIQRRKTVIVAGIGWTWCFKHFSPWVPSKCSVSGKGDDLLKGYFSLSFRFSTVIFVYWGMKIFFEATIKCFFELKSWWNSLMLIQMIASENLVQLGGIEMVLYSAMCERFGCFRFTTYLWIVEKPSVKKLLSFHMLMLVRMGHFLELLWFCFDGASMAVPNPWMVWMFFYQNIELHHI
jgi:hypothetical protein